MASPQVNIPNFKIAKVNTDRRRKGFGLPLLPLAGPGGKISLVSVLASKVGVMLLTLAISAGGAGLAKMLAPAQQRAIAAHREKSKAEAARSFEKKDQPKPQYQGDTSKLPGAQAPGQSSLNMITGSADGLTDEERERLAAEAQAKADAEAKAKAEEEAKAQAAAAAAANPLGAAPAAAGKPGMQHGFGSSAFKGPGLKGGGGGLSGGIGRDFGRDISMNKGKADAMQAGRANAGLAKGSAAQGGRMRGRTLSQRQLSRAAGFSGQAAGASGDAASSFAAQAFDGGGKFGFSITGGGASVGGRGAGGNQGADPTPNPTTTDLGGGAAGNTCPTDPAAIEKCTKDGGSWDNVECKCKGGEKADNSDVIISIIKGLLIAAMAILTAIAILSLTKNIPPYGTLISSAVFAGLCVALGVIGAAIGGLGGYLMSLHYNIFGGIYIGIGAAVLISAIAVYAGAGAQGTIAWQAGVVGAVAGAAALVGTLLNPNAFDGPEGKERDKNAVGWN